MVYQSGNEEDVRQYYDRNTGVFLRFSRVLKPHAIHQPLYEHAQMSPTEALHTQHRKVLGLIPQEDQELHVLDLGCGVGESIVYLARRTGHAVTYHGITLSGMQVRRARKYIARTGLDRRIHLYHGSFQSLPPEIPRVSIAFAIESLIHSPDAEVFFHEVASRLNVGGLLVVFDDFIVNHGDFDRHKKYISDYRTGWLAHSLLKTGYACAYALSAGLFPARSEDLTGMLQIYRLQDKVVRVVAPLARPLLNVSQYCRFLVGGDARQRAYQAGILQYRMMTFVKR